ncbi:transporter substrate-binding domain-containing protein [Indioceanicola profundi]|uniref:transporter substrate-binding domain-containing protein n=1 Tax=Indioceanicola profundi TaxID=2220096 RepID=UPI000E6AA7B3|nr:transporter substrate-binding domain-containing protein [Indioceanicola profundi]
MKKRIAAALALAATLALAGCGDDQPSGQAGVDTPVPDPLRIATEGAYPPYNMTDPSGKLIGFEIDLANEICRRLEVACQITAQNWDGIIPGLQAGRYDAIMAGMSITTERQQVVDFTTGYATTPGYFVALNDSPLHQLDTGLERVNLTVIDPVEQTAIDQMKEALKGKTVGVQVATIHANFLDTYLGDVVSIRRYDTQENLALDLSAGRIDAGLADAVAWSPFLNSPAGQNAGYIGPGFDGGVFGQGIGIAVRKDEPRLLAALNDTIAAMKEDGTIRQMAEQWFGFDASMH